MRIINILVYLSCIVLPFSAKTQIVLQSTVEQALALQTIEIAEDSSQSLRYIIDNQKKLFKPHTGSIQAHRSYWLRITVHNTSQSQQWVLLVDAVKYAQLYEPISMSQYRCREYGYSIADQYKPMTAAFSEAMPFEVSQNQTKTLYLHLKTDIEIYNHQCNLSIIGKDEYSTQQNYHNILYGLFYGLLLMLVLVSLALAIGLQDTALAIYALFVGSFAFFLFTMQGFTSSYIFPWWGNIELLAPTIGFVALQCFLLFFRLFMNLKHHHPRLNIRVRYWMIFSGIIIVGLLVSMFLQTDIYFIGQRAFIIINQIVSILLLLPLLRTPNKQTRLFLKGCLGLLIGSIIYTLGSIWGISNKQMLPAIQWGFMVQVIYFAWGLLHRYRSILSYKNDMQKALIDELIEKDIQQQQQNAHLEELVTTRTQEIDLQNKKLARINLKHAEGIHAAATLQRNLFPNKENIERRFASSFVWWQPQQEIGGDFYWFHETQRGQMLLVVADCTGHGVPGAITAIMGRDFLEEVVVKQNEIWPDKILQSMNKRFIERFGNQPDGELRFGMDVSIVLFDRQTRRAWFSGARQHMLIARGGKIERVRGELFGIGDNTRTRQYTLHDFSLTPTDTIYLYTDGYQHQLRSGDLRKYGGKHLREFLQTIITQPLPEQKKLLEAEWLKWRGQNNEQTDDMLIVGCMLLRGKPESAQ